MSSKPKICNLCGKPSEPGRRVWAGYCPNCRKCQSCGSSSPSKSKNSCRACYQRYTRVIRVRKTAVHLVPVESLRFSIGTRGKLERELQRREMSLSEFLEDILSMFFAGQSALARTRIEDYALQQPDGEQ